jgi:membrane fusion protein (multidrug efflux system)
MPAWLVPLLTFVSAALLFVIISSVWTSWENDVSVKTDDAYVRADVAPLSTKASGIVQTTRVSDFQAVKKGQILVELKSLEYRARVEQAREAIHQVEIKLADMKQRKEQQDARVAEARASLENSRTSVTQVDDTISSATATIEEAKAGIEAARAAIDQSIAAITAAAADVTKTVLERHRQEALLAEESTTKEKVEQVVDEHERTVANLAAQKAAQAKARAELVARQALLEKASQELARSRAEKKKSLMLVQTHEHELTAQIKQRDLLDGEEKQLISELAAKKAGLTAAQVDLDYTIVRAPVDGVVGEVKVKPGQLVSAGTHVVTLISAKPWVIANYRETQLAKVREGDEATVEIDALPGRHLKGHVERIAPASGAQFSLLPPDNASGNFTKIIQRIPVKISFDDAADNLSDLRPGMSAIATIKPETSGRH